MKPNQLGAFDFLAGLRACGLAGLRASLIAFVCTTNINLLAQTTNDAREKLNLDKATEIERLKGLSSFTKSVLISQGQAFVNIISTTIREFESQDAYFQGTAKAVRILLENYVV